MRQLSAGEITGFIAGVPDDFAYGYHHADPLGGSGKLQDHFRNCQSSVFSSIFLEIRQPERSVGAGDFKTYFLNSAFITGIGMFVVFLTACPAGYAFAQMSFPGNKLLLYLFIFGWSLPVQAIIIPVFFQLKSLGLVNTLTGITLVSVGMALPFSVFLMRNTFKDVPKELRESAYVDGAGEWRAFLYIMLPMAKPGIVALMVFTFMNIWNDFCCRWSC